MSVTIRLKRQGKRNAPFYHIVAADSRRARDGKFLEKLGYYDPGLEPSRIEIVNDRVQYWYGQGATLSNTVANLLKIKKITLTRPGKASTTKG